MTATVSIVMPTFNGSRYIDEAIASVIAQTHQDWELIIVDDGTPDGPPSNIDRWAATDSRIRTFAHQTNQGLPAALNTGARMIHGDYFTWLSDDDILRPDALETMVSFLTSRPDIDAVYTDYTEIDESGRPLGRVTVGDADLLGVSNPIGVCHLRRAAVFDTVGYYAQDFFLAEDLDMWIRLHRHCRIAPLHDDLFLYRRHDRSLSSTARRRTYAVHERVLDRHLHDMHWLDSSGRAWAYIRLVRHACEHRDAAAVARLTAKSLHASPTFVPRKALARRRDRAEASRRAQRRRDGRGPHLFWVYTQPPADTLDSATWLETSHELRLLGWDVTLVAPGRGGNATVRGVDVLLVERPDVYVLGQAVFHARAARLIRRQRAELDIVLFHEMSAPWLIPLRLMATMWLRRPKFVMDTRTLHMTSSEHQDLRGWARKVLYGLAGSAAKRLADGQTAITQRMARAKGVPPSRLWGVWPSGVTPEPFTTTAATRSYPTAIDDPVRLIYVGCLDHERTLMVVVDAVGAAREQGMNFELVLVGSGSEADELAARSEGDRYLTTLGRVDHRDIPLHLAAAHVGILPFADELKFQVSSPIKLFEYLASGLTVAATRIACNTDVLEGQPHVEWIDGSDERAIVEALARLWDDRFSLRERSHTAQAQSTDWTWKRAAAQLDRALRTGAGLTSAEVTP